MSRILLAEPGVVLRPGAGITSWWSLSCVNTVPALFLLKYFDYNGEGNTHLSHGGRAFSLRLISPPDFLAVSFPEASDRAGYRCLPFQTIVDGHGVFRTMYAGKRVTMWRQRCMYA